MHKIKKALSCAMLLASVGIFAGCAPTVSVIDEEALKSLEAMKQKDELYYQGFKDGVEWCNEGWFTRLQSEMENLKRQKLWSKYVKGGYVKPPLIAEVYVPPKISEDGKVYSPASVEYVILEDARFVSESLLQRLTEKTSLVFLGLFYTDESLEKRKDEVLKYLKQKKWENDVFVETFLTASGKGKALIIRTEDQSKAKVISNDLGGEIVQ